MTFILFLGACSQDDDNLSADNSILTLFTQMETPVTRLTINNTWSGNEIVRIVLDDASPSLPFSVDAGGKLTPQTALYWQAYSHDGISARAWYPGNYTYPADQKTVFNNADFIFAETVTGITKDNYTTTGKKLQFKHKLAQVTVSFRSGYGGINVRPPHIEPTLYGYTTIATIDTSGVNKDGKIIGAVIGEIKPKTPPSDTTALLIPKTYTNENFIKVKDTDSGKEYYYKPASLTLEEGVHYKFIITINATRLTVTSQIVSWEGSTDEVTTVWSFNPATGTLTLLAGFVLGNDLSGITGITGLDLSQVKSLVIEGTMTDAQLLKLKTLNNNSNTGSLSALESITLSNQTGALPEDFFWVDDYGGVQWIKSISAPKVTELHLAAFQNCYNLASADFPKVVSTGINVFERTALTTVTLPDLETLGIAAFKNCPNLTTVVLPKVTQILGAGDGNLWECPNLTSVTFGSALTSIHPNTFGGSTDESKIDLHLCAAEYALASGNTWRGWTFKSITAIP